MEHIREIKIIIEIDTNKTTYQKEFDNIEQATKFFNEIIKIIKE